MNCDAVDIALRSAPCKQAKLILSPSKQPEGGFIYRSAI